jgi:hypothetical protein
MRHLMLLIGLRIQRTLHDMLEDFESADRLSRSGKESVVTELDQLLADLVEMRQWAKTEKEKSKTKKQEDAERLDTAAQAMRNKAEKGLAERKAEEKHNVIDLATPPPPPQRRQQPRDPVAARLASLEAAMTAEIEHAEVARAEQKRIREKTAAAKEEHRRAKEERRRVEDERRAKREAEEHDLRAEELALRRRKLEVQEAQAAGNQALQQLTLQLAARLAERGGPAGIGNIL